MTGPYASWEHRHLLVCTLQTPFPFCAPLRYQQNHPSSLHTEKLQFHWSKCRTSPRCTSPMWLRMCLPSPIVSTPPWPQQFTVIKLPWGNAHFPLMHLIPEHFRSFQKRAWKWVILQSLTKPPPLGSTPDTPMLLGSRKGSPNLVGRRIFCFRDVVMLEVFSLVKIFDLRPLSFGCFFKCIFSLSLA